MAGVQLWAKAGEGGYGNVLATCPEDESWIVYTCTAVARDHGAGGNVAFHIVVNGGATSVCLSRGSTLDAPNGVVATHAFVMNAGDQIVFTEFDGPEYDCYGSGYIQAGPGLVPS